MNAICNENTSTPLSVTSLIINFFSLRLSNKSQTVSLSGVEDLSN